VCTVGVVVEPRMIKNLTVTMDYYNFDVSQSISTIGESVILQGCYPLDPSATPKYCDKIVRGSNGRIVNIINLNANVGEDKTDGIDVAVRYAYPTDVGRFGFIFDGTWLHKFDRTLADASIIHGRGTFDLNGAGTGGVYPAFKFNAGVTYALRGFGAGVTTRFIGSFTECGDSGGDFSGSGLCYQDATYQHKVAAYNTWDAYVSYGLTSPAGKTTIAAGINNAFDKNPSVIYNGFLAASDPTAYDFQGRRIYARLAHTF